MTKPSNPPAFPGFERDCNHVSQPINGMTLRDYFAGQALAGLLAMVQGESADVWQSVDKAATYSYQYADAMLKSREVSHE